MPALSIFVLTGAGVSAESGLGTFRDRGGLWSRFDPMKLATPEAFARDPDLVHEFYNLRRRGVIEAEPNAAHFALARLEQGVRERGGEFFLCTQNVDDLHERAGSQAVTHIHGELLKARCLACDSVTPWREDITTQTPCPHCKQTGGMRPDIVWFGEIPRKLDAIESALLGSELFVAIGTSGAVYPAAGYVAQAKQFAIRTCELNLEPSDNAASFDEARYGKASEIVPAWVDELLAG